MRSTMEAMEQHRYERVLIETARHRIEGTITLQRDGYRSRVSDVLNATERDFVALTDVIVEPLVGDDPTARHELVIVARAQIVLAIPLSEQHASAPSDGTADGPSHPPPPLQSV